ncbi:MAG: LytR family transcriptional regulator [Ruminiclostridium sp.]|nr:LytR family transcriptional regulator [Ruminiclostridium sp.]
MAKKNFLIFAIIMVCVTGAAFYGIYTKAENQLKAKKQPITAKLPEKAPNEASHLLPQTYTTEIQSPQKADTPKTITNGQKYYTPLSTADSKNILLIGKDPCYSNFDILIIVSVDEKNKTVSMVDLPRDIYIDYTDAILEELQKNDEEFYHEKGAWKLNAANVVGRKIKYCPQSERFAGKREMNFLTDLIEEVFGIGIDDYMAIETDGFREVVDYFGGVVVDVPYAMDYEDPLQDLYIHLEPGLQVLDGTQAEKFVRFRQGYNEFGRMVSYSRAENTFLFLKSFFKQHVTLRNLNKAGKVYEIVKENTATSVQTLGDCYQYARLVTKVLEDDYTIESTMVECIESRNIDGARYDIIRSEQLK